MSQALVYSPYKHIFIILFLRKLLLTLTNYINISLKRTILKATMWILTWTSYSIWRTTVNAGHSYRYVYTVPPETCASQ